MSHHIVNLLPGLLPLERPVKPDKKRRLRKTRPGEVSYAQDIDEVSAVDDDLFVLGSDEGGEEIEASPAEIESRPSAGSLFSHAAMKTLLEAQAETKTLF